jgi:hypothetical protein
MSKFQYIHLPQRGDQWKFFHSYPLDPFTTSASVVPHIVGLKSNPSVNRLWEYYHKVKDIPNLDHVPAVKFGREHEGDALDSLEKKFQHLKFGYRGPGPIKHSKYDWLHASCDCIYYFPALPTGEELLNAEVKCKPNSALPRTKDDVLLPDIVQVLTQMEVTHIEHSVLIYWKSPTEWTSWYLPKDDRIGKLLIDAILSFKNKMLEPHTPTQRNTTPPMLANLVQLYRSTKILSFERVLFQAPYSPN